MRDRARPTIERVLVAGAGSWGTIVANLLALKGLDVRIWAGEEELAAGHSLNGVLFERLPPRQGYLAIWDPRNGRDDD